MHCGSSWRTPLRRTALAYAGRLALLGCLLACAFGPAATTASAYFCGRSPTQTRTLQGRSLKDCDQPTSRARRGNADAMSFVFFMGIIFGFVLVPVGLARREGQSPE